jgi:ribosomal protein S18 acetylase RimI-like enzyme
MEPEVIDAMYRIRSRIPDSDDRFIIRLVKERLFPFTQDSMPGMTFNQLEIKERLRRGRTFVMDSPNRGPVGFIHTLTNKDDLWVDMLAVNESAQGSGAGSALLQQAEAYGRSHGCQTARLFVDLQNFHAQQFYMRRGYELERYEPRVNCYLLRKPLRFGTVYR